MSEVKPDKGSKATVDEKSTEVTKNYLDDVLNEENLDPELKDIVQEEVRGVLKTKTIADEDLPPVFINGEPFAIVNEKYVPFDKAQIIFIDKKIEQLRRKQRFLKYQIERNALVKEKADREIAEKKKIMEKKREEQDKIVLKNKRRIEKELNKF